MVGLRPKKLYVSLAPSVSPSTTYPKNVYCSKYHQLSIVSLIWPPHSFILFLVNCLFSIAAWLLHVLKVGNFGKVLECIIFISRSMFKKNYIEKTTSIY